MRHKRRKKIPLDIDWKTRHLIKKKLADSFTVMEIRLASSPDSRGPISPRDSMYTRTHRNSFLGGSLQPEFTCPLGKIRVIRLAAQICAPRSPYVCGLCGLVSKRVHESWC